MDSKLKSSLEVLHGELNAIKQKQIDKTKELKNLLATAPIEKDLLLFYCEGCSFTKRIEPDVMEVEIKLGKQLHKLETWNSEENQKLYDEVGGTVSCGGVPFFYNRSTKQSICGAKGLDALLAWAVVNKKD